MLVCFAYWSGKERFVLFLCPVHDALLCLLVRYRTLCFAYWSGTDCVVLLIGPVQNALCFKSGTLRFVLLIGPVQNALFCFMVMFPNLKLLVPKLGTTGYHCKELPVSRAWNFSFLTLKPQDTIARNSRFPEIGTPGSEP